MSRASALLAILLSLFLRPAVAAPPSHVYALKGGTVYPVTGVPIPDATVVLRDGIIESVGPSASVEVPYDAVVIDAKGLSIYPGFIDAHSKVGVPSPKSGEEPTRGGGADPSAAEASESVPASMPEDLRRGLQPDRLAADDLSIDDGAAKPYREQGFTAALTAPDSGMLMGQSALVNLSGRPTREAIVRNRVALHAALRTPGGNYPDSLMGAIGYLRQTLLDARRYAVQWKVYDRNPVGRRRPPVDPTLAALQEALSGTLPVVFEANDKNGIERALRFGAEFGFRCLLCGGLEAHKIAPALRERDVPVILSVNFPEEPKRKERKDAEKKPPETGKPKRAPGEAAQAPESIVAVPSVEKTEKAETPASSPEAPADKPERVEEPSEDEEPVPIFEEKHRRWEETVRGASTLVQAGVRIAFQTADAKSPAEFAKNLGVAIEKGLPRDAALRALTIEPARLLGVERQLGSIEVGKIANLAVLTGDFGDSKAKVKIVFVDGIRFDMKGADKLAAAVPTGTQANVTGTWDVTTNLDQGGTLLSVVELKQSGSSITGTLKSQMGEATISSGSVTGSAVSISATASFGGRSFDFTYSGTLDGDALSGTVTSPMGEATFTARRRATPKSAAGEDEK